MLSRKISRVDAYRTLGRQVLNQPNYQVDATLFNHKNKVDDAAQDILLYWYNQQTNPSEAYHTLYRALMESEIRELTNWMKGLGQDEEQKAYKGMLGLLNSFTGLMCN